MRADEIMLKPDFIKQVEDLYQDMEETYDQTAKALDFSQSISFVVRKNLFLLSSRLLKASKGDLGEYTHLSLNSLL